jgi:hypothetical protein
VGWQACPPVGSSVRLDVEREHRDVDLVVRQTGALKIAQSLVMTVREASGWRLERLTVVVEHKRAPGRPGGQSDIDSEQNAVAIEHKCAPSRP